MCQPPSEQQIDLTNSGENTYIVRWGGGQHVEEMDRLKNILLPHWKKSKEKHLKFKTKK